MRRERERDLVPTDVQVGMMLRLLGQFGDGVGEIHRGGKILKLKCARNHVAVSFPLRQIREREDDLRFRQFHLSGRKTFERFQTDLGRLAQWGPWPTKTAYLVHLALTVFTALWLLRAPETDRKSTRLNSSHANISYA